MFIIGLEWLACSLCILGGILIARKNITGFWVTILSDVLLVWYGFLTVQYGLVALAIAYGIINIYGIWYWNNMSSKEL